MAADNTQEEPQTPARNAARLEHVESNGKDSVEERESDEDEDEDEDDADEEPKLKYSRLTSSLGPVYRNGDATSTFIVAGDKMVRLQHKQLIHRASCIVEVMLNYDIDCGHP
jgi:hypothetical protein